MPALGKSMSIPVAGSISTLASRSRPARPASYGGGPPSPTRCSRELPWKLSTRTLKPLSARRTGSPEAAAASSRLCGTAYARSVPSPAAGSISASSCSRTSKA